jgi:sulfopyruvate decarboxylase TPP-binding subunit
MSLAGSVDWRAILGNPLTGLPFPAIGATVPPGFAGGGLAMAGGSGERWQDALYDLLRRHNVTQFAYVPDAGHRILIDRSLADPGVHSVALTTEEEGVALMAGADLGGARGVLLMQSSGAGNCINMLSLIKGGRFPFLTILSMRGDFGEGNPWQFPMGQAVEPVLQAMGVIVLRAEKPDEVIPTVEAALTMVFQSGNAVAVLLTQKLLGAKAF